MLVMAVVEHYLNSANYWYLPLAPSVILVGELLGMYIFKKWRYLFLSFGFITAHFILLAENTPVADLGLIINLLVLVARALYHINYENANFRTLWVFRSQLMLLPVLYLATKNNAGLFAQVFFGLILTFLFIGLQQMVLTNKIRLEKLRVEKQSLARDKELVLSLNSLLSHNLRTPIAQLIGQLQILELKYQDNQSFKELGFVGESIINQLNVIVDSKKAVANSANFREFIDNWSSQYQNRISVKGESRNPLLKTEVLSIIYMALSVFTDNSLEHGAKNIEVEIHDSKITHRDDGDGMSANQLERFGTPLLSSKQNHSGLGIHVVVKSFELLGLKWEVDSALGKGTEISIFI